MTSASVAARPRNDTIFSRDAKNLEWFAPTARGCFWSDQIPGRCHWATLVCTVGAKTKPRTHQQLFSVFICVNLGPICGQFSVPISARSDLRLGVRPRAFALHPHSFVLFVTFCKIQATSQKCGGTSPHVAAYISTDLSLHRCHFASALSPLSNEGSGLKRSGAVLSPRALLPHAFVRGKNARPFAGDEAFTPRRPHRRTYCSLASAPDSNRDTASKSRRSIAPTARHPDRALIPSTAKKGGLQVLRRVVCDCIEPLSLFP